MKFRTEIEPIKAAFRLSHDDCIVALGSCFAEEVGRLLERDGFDVTVNPLGPLYNPASLLRGMKIAMGMEQPLIIEHGGMWHCTDFASRYSHAERQVLEQKTHADLATLGAKLRSADTLIITLGTAWVFDHNRTGSTVGNCHKIPASEFTRHRLGIDAVADCCSRMVELMPKDCRIIFTVSPIRHMADGLHGNNLSKATLLLGLDKALQQLPRGKADYFPSYEIVLDDLRDYRFYDSDLKHPSHSAVDYIYEIFSSAYFEPDTIAVAQRHRAEALRAAHRQILNNP